MKVAVLTNRNGFNRKQTDAFKKFATDLRPAMDVFIIGGEEYEANIINLILSLGFSLEIYPQDDRKFTDDVKVHEPLPFATRNRTMVEKADAIIAVPMIVFEDEDSPLWKTTRYAVSLEKEVNVISPRGHIWVTGDSE